MGEFLLKFTAAAVFCWSAVPRYLAQPFRVASRRASSIGQLEDTPLHRSTPVCGAAVATPGLS